MTAPAGEVAGCWSGYFLDEDFVGVIWKISRQRHIFTKPVFVDGFGPAVSSSGKLNAAPHPHRQMKRKIDTDEGRYQYSKRLGIVEPVFIRVLETRC